MNIPNSLFLPELKFIELEGAFPGALNPNIDKSITFNGQSITPLLPLNSILLNHLTPKELLNLIKIESLSDNHASKVRISLNLTDVQSEFSSGNCYQDYELKEENCLGDQLPVLQVWPYFKTKGWQQYYVFYYDGELAERTFQISCADAQHKHHFQEGLGTYKIYQLTKFPPYLSCTDFDNKEIGLILLQSPEEIVKRNTWQVGLDFDNFFSNVYVKTTNTIETLSLPNLQLQVTNSDHATRVPVLFEYLIG